MDVSRVGGDRVAYPHSAFMLHIADGRSGDPGEQIEPDDRQDGGEVRSARNNIISDAWNVTGIESSVKRLAVQRVAETPLTQLF